LQRMLASGLARGKLPQLKCLFLWGQDLCYF
jgi:hypothetical protein